ncbi:hypothetical protein [uncultured Mycobacterium sp.]|uniref:hypothetical protein n=1 Tax=uncultured Mycobacterium sp. TaxID=171292 RepID=UPI0035CB9505
MTIDQPRRDYLTAKYDSISHPPRTGDPTVDAILDGEHIMARSMRQGTDNGLLFDPIRSPSMYEVADRTMRELRAAMACDEVKYVTPRGGHFNRDKASDDRVLYVHFVGDKRLFACRGRKSADLFADLLYASAWVWRQDECNIKVADDCGGGTLFFPLQRGQFLLLFECCQPCLDKAVDMATTGFIVSEMEARVRVGQSPL